MYCEKLHYDPLFLKEYVICPFCFLLFLSFIQEINDKNNQKTHCCG